MFGGEHMTLVASLEIILPQPVPLSNDLARKARGTEQADTRDSVRILTNSEVCALTSTLTVVMI
jgi:hypothetical protein